MSTVIYLQIHWFSIINSCVTVLLLTGFLATILMRVLKNDFLKYARDDEGVPKALKTVPQILVCITYPSLLCENEKLVLNWHGF